MRLYNRSDEAITIEPGETVHLIGESDTRRGLVSRSDIFLVDGLREVATANG